MDELTMREEAAAIARENRRLLAALAIAQRAMADIERMLIATESAVSVSLSGISGRATRARRGVTEAIGERRAS